LIIEIAFFCIYTSNISFKYLMLVLIFQIKSFVANEAAEYKKLTGGVKFTGAIPKSASGKILRKDLLKQFKETGQ